MPQKIVGASGVFANVDALGNLSVTTSDIVVSGSITTQNLNPNTGVATAGSTVATANLSGADIVAVQVSGVYTGALSVQGTVDGVNWVAISAGLINYGTAVLSSSITSAAVGIWANNVAGLFGFRVTALAAVTGTATVTLKVSNAVSNNRALITGNTGGAVDAAVGGAAPANNLWVAPAATVAVQGSTNQLFNAALTTAVVKATLGNLYGFSIQNTSAAVVFLQFYNQTTVPTLGTSVVFSIAIPIGVTNWTFGDLAMWNGSVGLGIGASTTPTAAGTPSVAPTIVVFFK